MWISTNWGPCRNQYLSHWGSEWPAHDTDICSVLLQFACHRSRLLSKRKERPHDMDAPNLNCIQFSRLISIIRCGFLRDTLCQSPNTISGVRLKKPIFLFLLKAGNPWRDWTEDKSFRISSCRLSLNQSVMLLADQQIQVTVSLNFHAAHLLFRIFAVHCKNPKYWAGSIPKLGTFIPFFGIESDSEIGVTLKLPELLIQCSQFCKRWLRLLDSSITQKLYRQSRNSVRNTRHHRCQRYSI